MTVRYIAPCKNPLFTLEKEQTVNIGPTLLDSTQIFVCFQSPVAGVAVGFISESYNCGLYHHHLASSNAS